MVALLPSPSYMRHSRWKATWPGRHIHVSPGHHSAFYWKHFHNTVTQKNPYPDSINPRGCSKNGFLTCWNWYPPAIKHGLLENEPFTSDFPTKTSIPFGDFLASHVWWHQMVSPSENCKFHRLGHQFHAHPVGPDKVDDDQHRVDNQWNSTSLRRAAHSYI